MKKEDEDILFFAFRYALGRQSGVVDFMVTQLKKHWKDFNYHTQVQIQREITEYPTLWQKLHYSDIWKEILDLKVKSSSKQP